MKKLLAFVLMFAPAGIMAQSSFSNGVIVGSGPKNSYTDVVTANLLPGTKKQSSPGEYQPIGAGATTTLIDYVGSGVVTNIWININGDSNANLNSTINVYYEGHSSPDISVPIAFFFGVPGASLSANTVRHSKLFDVTFDAPDNQMNYASRVRMPFTSEFKMTITNAGGAISNGLFWNVEYQTGLPNIWANTRHLKIATIAGTTCTPDQLITLFNLGSGNAGRFLDLSFYLSGSANANFQEGNFYLFLNGALTPDASSSGFEDEYEQGHNFRGQSVGNQLFNGQEGIFLWSGSFPSNPVGAFRTFIDDPIVYFNGIVWKWGCGESAHGSSGTATLNISMFYYDAT